MRSLRLYQVLVVPHDVLVLLGGPAEALGAELAAVWVVLSVDRDDMALEA